MKQANRYISHAAESIERGYKYIQKLNRELLSKRNRYFVFLFSKDSEINDYTLYYLPVLRKEKDISTFVIVTPFMNLENEISNKCEVPYIFRQCYEREMDDICRYYYSIPDITYKRNICRMIINGYGDIQSERIQEYIGINGINKKEIVALAIFWFSKVPTEKEVLDACKYEPKIKENIDWDRYICEEFDDPPVFPENVDAGLDSLIRSGAISHDDKVVIFSNTKTTRHIIKRLSDYDIIAVLDNNPGLAGECCEGINIHTPNEYLSDVHRDDIKIIVPTRSYKAICEQLYEYGYRIGEQVFVTYIEYNPYNIKRIRSDFDRGHEIYGEIREIYPDERLYFITYPGIGDTYIAGMYLAELMVSDGMDGGVVLFMTETCRKVFSILNHGAQVKGEYVVGNSQDALRLLLFIKQVGYDVTNVCNITHSYDLIDPGYLRGYKGLDFNTMLQKVVYKADSKRIRANIVEHSESEWLKDKNLRRGKTVILAPYAKAIRQLPDDFWTELTGKLISSGYDVYTNVSENENPIEDTTALDIPLEYIVEAVETCGNFIGLRSGLCDLISGARAKKVILYSGEHAWGTDYTYSFFSLTNMGLADNDTYELILDGDYHEMVDEIMSIVVLQS